MKKTYMIPVATAVEVKLQQMLAESIQIDGEGDGEDIGVKAEFDLDGIF